MQPFISVIVPVYNAQPYLHRCIDSILSQTFTDFELLLVDDGSTDQSGAICDEYARKNSRIKVFHKVNGGVSSARNWGLDNAKGEWVTFVDSDDWLKSTYLHGLISFAKKKIDLIISYPETNSQAKVVKPKVYTPKWVITSDFADLFVLYDINVYTTSWAKLYKLTLIQSNGIRFNEKITMGEDTVFFYTYLLVSSNIYVSNIVGYCYHNTPDSLSKRFYSVDAEWESYVNIRSVINALIEQKQISDYKALSNLQKIISYYIWRVIECLYLTPVPFKDRIKTIKSLDWSFIDNLSMNAFFKLIIRHKFWGLYDFFKMIVSKKRLICSGRM